MKKLLLASVYGLLASWPALGADLPPKPPLKAIAAPTVASPFYVFVHGGAGVTNVQNDIALPGVATGTPKLWPAGAMVGGGLGYLSSIGPISIGLEAEGNYDFTRASINNTVPMACADGASAVCVGALGSVHAKNSWFFAEKALVGITLSQITGYVPGATSPANWPVPITVPAGFAFGQPVGLSFIGRAWSEALLVKFAYAYEQATRHRHPPTFSPTADLTAP